MRGIPAIRILSRAASSGSIIDAPLRDTMHSAGTSIIMNPDDIIIVEYSSVHSDELVRMWRRSFESAVGITDPHSIEEQREYLERTVIAENQVLVVLLKSTTEVIGFLASTPERVAQLYVHVAHQGHGIGTMLLDIAKERSTGRLRLFTFAANVGAQAFYERHGFNIVARGFEPDWGLEDIEYEWVRVSNGTAD